MCLVRRSVALGAVLFWGAGLSPHAVAQTAPSAAFSVAADAGAVAPRGMVEQVPMTGSLVRAIPIEAPAFHGIEPHLALAYSSGGGNGYVGVGWSLSGFSVIERTRNGRGTPRFTSTDVYVLDGQELLPCSQLAPPVTSPGCLAGGTHATKQESYSKITLAGNVWSIWSRNGVRTDLTPIYAGATGATWRWGQTSVRDAHAPANTVTYAWECVGGDCYPKSVSYGPFFVTLYREAAQRPDVLSFATGGATGLGRTLYRLGSVVVTRGGSQNGTMIRAYRLSYASSAATSRSLLTEVQQFGTGASVSQAGVVTGNLLLPPQTFTYQAAE